MQTFNSYIGAAAKHNIIFQTFNLLTFWKNQNKSRHLCWEHLPSTKTTISTKFIPQRLFNLILLWHFHKNCIKRITDNYFQPSTRLSHTMHKTIKSFISPSAIVEAGDCIYGLQHIKVASLTLHCKSDKGKCKNKNKKSQNNKNKGKTQCEKHEIMGEI